MKRIRIIAVDDNVVNLRTLVQELQYLYEVVPMSSGSRALRYLQKETADLILLDVEMPDMDGIETLTEIREHSRGVMIPVIFLTSNNDRNTVMEGMKLGIVDYIVKPFQRDDLLNRIERTLKKQGVIPMDRYELQEAINELEKQINCEQWKQAAAKAKEISGYQIDKEIAGRVRTISNKLEMGDHDAADQAMNRVSQLMKAQASSGKRSYVLSQLEWSVLLHNILDALENFRMQEAVDKLNDLLNYNMPEERRKQCEEVLSYIKHYDDTEAENLLLQLLDQATKSF